VKVGHAIEETAGAEQQLAEELWKVGERHKADHDVFHVTKTLAGLSRDHVAKLASHAGRYSASIDREAGGAPERPRAIDALLEKGAELAGRRPEPALLLLHDLRRLYLVASEASIDWVMLAQGAQAVKDAELLETVSACHVETLRTVKWATNRIKTAAPQVLAAG
jgi:hypothetical protein